MNINKYILQTPVRLHYTLTYNNAQEQIRESWIRHSTPSRRNGGASMEQILLSRAVGEDSAEWVQEAEAGIRHSSQQNLKQELPQRLLKKAEDPERVEQGG